MSIILNKIILAPISEDGVPKYGLSPTIHILDALNGNLLVSSGSMTELSLGWYKYTFNQYDTTGSYAMLIDAGSEMGNSQRYYYAGNETSYEDIWNAPYGSNSYIQTGTMGKMLVDMEEKTEKIKNHTEGRWLITGSQMVFYQHDNITEIARYELKDKFGNPFFPDNKSPTERIKVS